MGNIGSNCRQFCQVEDFKAGEITSQPSKTPGYFGSAPSQISTNPNVCQVYKNLTLSADWLQSARPIRLHQREAFYYGDSKDHKPVGLARIIFDDGSFFEGTFQNGSVNCPDGLFIYKDGSYYLGGIYSDKANGRGKIIYKVDQTLVYEGEWKDDVPHGFGKETTKDGWQYVGHFAKGAKQGKGRLQWPDGDFYLGDFNDGFITGEGEMVSADGSYRYKGLWLKNKKHGKGQQIFNQEGFVYEGFKFINKGEFANDLRDGPGKWTDKDGVVNSVFYRQGTLATQ